MDTVINLLNEIWVLFLEMSPYLLLGFLIAGVLHVFIPKQFFAKHLGKPGLLSSFKAALIGVPLPLCSCGVIPTGVSIYKNGAKKGPTNAFLISTPQTGVDSILITYSLMNIYWAISRPIIALITGVFGGWLTEKLEGSVLQNSEPIPLVPEKKVSEDNLIKRLFNYAFVDFLSDISRQLLLGVLLAAIITTIIPTSFFENYMNQPILNMLIILLASIPLYVCATGSVPIATALLMSGVSPGAVLVFLMAGPATNIATITVLWNTIGKKATIAYLLSIIIAALAFGFIIDYVLNPDYFLLSSDTTATHNHQSYGWFAISSALILIALLGFVEIKKLIPSHLKINHMEIRYSIDGMTCNHCKSNVENGLNQLENVDQATVDLNSKSVIIEGNVSAKEVETIVTGLGYKYKGKIK